MNKTRREFLSKATALLVQASELVLRALDEEQACLDNIPENLQDSQMSQKMEDIIDGLEQASESIEDAINAISSATEL